jgi:hypothetical protein
MSILEAMADPDLFGRWFKPNLRRGDSWKNWRIFLSALFALPLSGEEKEVYRQFTGRDDFPSEQANEAWLVCGRRSGKSLIASLIAVFLACFRNYEDILAPGELATVMVIASDKKQSRVVLSYINGFFDSIPILSSVVQSRVRESVVLKNRIHIEVHTASFRAVRGYTIVCAILDECAFFPTGDSAEPDTELVAALRPAMATVPGALLLGISSPYAKRGVLWESFREHYGQASAPVLVWKADTRSMNSTVDSSTIQTALLRDRAAASSEYLAEFRDDVVGFLSLEVVSACVCFGRRELPPLRDVDYCAFCDPSGGRSDSMTLAIAHREGEHAVLDLVREVQPPFSPESTVAEFADTLRYYRILEVEGDRYGGEWPREQFHKRGVSYRVAERTKSEFYLEFLPLLTSGHCELLDNQRLITQLVGLDRRTARTGRDSVDHGPGGHDDLCNCVAGALVRAAGDLGKYGVLEFVKSGGFERVQRILDAKKSQIAEPAIEARACASCGGTLWQTIGNQLRCGQCGTQIWPRGAPEVPHFNRRNLPATGRALGLDREDRNFLSRWSRKR